MAGQDRQADAFQGAGLPYGHVPTKVVLLDGQKVDLLVQGREALLYWG